MCMNLKQLREEAGLRAEEAAFKLEIALSTLRNWESGKHKPTMTPHQFANVLKIYQCTLDDFCQAMDESMGLIKK